MRMVCKCGKTLSTTAVPNDVQLKVYTDYEWDNIIDLGHIDDTINIPRPKYDVWRCPKCERIYFFSDGNNVPEKVYVLEE